MFEPDYAPNPGRRLVSVRAAAAYLGIGTRLLYELMAAGRIPSVLVGTRGRRLTMQLPRQRHRGPLAWVLDELPFHSPVCPASGRGFGPRPWS